MEQIIASLGFQFEKVKTWRSQSIWKSIFYVAIAVLFANVLVYGVKWMGQPEVIEEDLPSFQITEDGLWYDQSFAFDVPVLDLSVMVGEEQKTDARQTLVLMESGWTFKRSGVETDLESYQTLLDFVGRSDVTEHDLDVLLKGLNWFYPIYVYGATMFDLVLHFLLISLLALAGLGFRRFVPICYKEAWTITAYGITAPLIVRTVIELLPINVPMLSVLYWATVGIFAFMTIQKIGDD
ncbi:DUF1189 domain-containing protein [Exiguobacterium sp. AT1b]|uniref:DUF1189 domain-containing protein n=1 Tax=Exiguobacterium sp. (strain ATCC BAA-1283 / AT1b) TaxID=360911 RepID=C4KYN6_EXISA|nr:DUF1189 domain-containing protein [Exiguobacterium sp. AT1b]ACQ70199.1 hypothetical protein EAT1b_1272 [Exiguobacterium sp. AT1b]